MRVCVSVIIHMCACVCTLVGGNIKITINDLQFSPHWNTSSVQSNDYNLLSPSPLTFLIYSSSSSPPFTGLTHSPTLSLYLAVFFSLSLLPLPSLFSLCYTVEQWKSFLYPTHHSPVTINSIYVCLNRRACEEHGHRPCACTSARAHMRTNMHVFPTHTHTGTHLISSIFSIT